MLSSLDSSLLSSTAACFNFFFFFEGKRSPIDMSSNSPAARFVNEDNFDSNVDIDIGDKDTLDVRAVLDGEELLPGDTAVEQYFSGLDCRPLFFDVSAVDNDWRDFLDVGRESAFRDLLLFGFVITSLLSLLSCFLAFTILLLLSSSDNLVDGWLYGCIVIWLDAWMLRCLDGWCDKG